MNSILFFQLNQLIIIFWKTSLQFRCDSFRSLHQAIVIMHTVPRSGIAARSVECWTHSHAALVSIFFPDTRIQEIVRATRTFLTTCPFVSYRRVNAYDWKYQSLPSVNSTTTTKKTTNRCSVCFIEGNFSLRSSPGNASSFTSKVPSMLFKRLHS